MSFSGYQIRGDVLASMRRAAGDFMPEYGNWRYKLNQPKEEEEEEEKEEQPDPENVPLHGEGTITTPGEDAVYEDVEVVEDFDKKWQGPKTDEYPDGMPYDVWIKQPGNQEKEDEFIKSKTKTESRLVDEGIEGSSEDWLIDGYRTPDGQLVITSLEGNVPEDFMAEHNITEQEIAAAQTNLNQGSEDVAMKYRERSPLKSSPYRKGELLTEGVELYRGVDRFLDSQVNKLEVNGSIATKAMHQHIENIAGDIKNNLFFRPAADKRGQRTNEAAATDAIQKIANSTKSTLSKNGFINTFYDNYKDNLVSESITDQEKYIMAHLIQPSKDIVPRVDENNHVTYMVPMPEGYMFPATSQWINETITKRTKPYSMAQKFVESKGQFFEAGRSGQPYDKEAIIMRNLRMVDNNPDLLAAAFIDRGLFHPRPLIDLMMEGEDADDSSPYNSGMQLDKKKFVLQALGDEATRKEMEQKFAEGLEKIAYDSYNRGMQKYNEENKQSNPTAGMSLEEKKKYYLS